MDNLSSINIVTANSVRVAEDERNLASTQRCRMLFGAVQTKNISDIVNRNFKQQSISIISTSILPFIRLYWFIFRPIIRGAKCIITHRDEILLIRHTYGKGGWTLPGGKIERNETPEEAIIREVKEELGFELENLRLIGRLLDTSEHAQNTIYCFVASVKDKEPDIDENEILEAKWHRLANLPQQLPALTRKILDLWSEQKV